MAVTKPRTRKGTISQRPPLSWPNDIAIGRRRPHLGLLRQATYNSQQHRMSNLSASSKRNISKSTQHATLHSQAPRASSFSSYKAHKRTHRSTQKSQGPRGSGKPPKRNKKPGPHAPQPWKKSKVPSNSSTDAKKAAKSQKASPIGEPSSPILPSHIEKTNLKLTHTRPAPAPAPAAKDIDWDAYHRAKAHRLKQIRIWVHNLRISHRIVASVAKELMAYYGSERYGAHPAASTLSEHAWQAVKLCEHEFGTDLQWGRDLGEAVWGSEHEKVERLIEMKMVGERDMTPGMGTVGESDLSEFDDEGGDADDEDEDEEEEEEEEEGKDVEMAETA